MSSHGHAAGHGHESSGGHGKKEGHLKLVKNEKSIDQIKNDQGFMDFIQTSDDANTALDQALNSDVKDGYEVQMRAWYEVYENREKIKKEFKDIFEKEVKPRFDAAGMKKIPEAAYKALYEKVDELAGEPKGKEQIENLINEWKEMKEVEAEIAKKEAEIEKIYSEIPFGKEGLEEERELINEYLKTAKKGTFSSFFRSKEEKAVLEKIEHRFGVKANWIKDALKTKNSLNKWMEDHDKRSHKIEEIESEIKKQKIELKSESLNVMRQFGLLQAVEGEVQKYLAEEAVEASKFDGPEIGVRRDVVQGRLETISEGLGELKKMPGITVFDENEVSGLEERMDKFTKEAGKNDSGTLSESEMSKLKSLLSWVTGAREQMDVFHEASSIKPEKKAEPRQVVLDFLSGIKKRTEKNIDPKIVAKERSVIDFINETAKKNPNKKLTKDQEEEAAKMVLELDAEFGDKRKSDEEVIKSTSSWDDLERAIEKNKISLEGYGYNYSTLELLMTVRTHKIAAANPDTAINGFLQSERRDKLIKNAALREKILELYKKSEPRRQRKMPESIENIFKAAGEISVLIEREKAKMETAETSGQKRVDAEKVLKIHKVFGKEQDYPGLDFLKLVRESDVLTEDEAREAVVKEVQDLVRKELLRLDEEKRTGTTQEKFKREIKRLIDKSSSDEKARETLKEEIRKMFLEMLGKERAKEKSDKKYKGKSTVIRNVMMEI